MITRLDKNVMLSQWMNVLRQLRPKATPGAVTGLLPWGYHFVNAIHDGKVVGLGTYFTSASLVRGQYHYLSDLVVDASCRGNGIGSSLLNQMFSTNRPCVLDSGLEKKEAHRFYLRHGFNNTGYTVRLQSSAFSLMGDFKQEKTVLVGNAENLRQLTEKERQSLQGFINSTVCDSSLGQADLQTFMKSNPNQHLLVLKGKSGDIEGILLFELQNRLYIGGECFHVSDLVVKPGESKQERQNALLLALVERAKNYNANNPAPVNSVIVEMSEEEIQSHNIQIGDKTREEIKAGGHLKAPSIATHSLFCATAKHFVKGVESADRQNIPEERNTLTFN